jgi:sulfate adenylyltransferase
VSAYTLQGADLSWLDLVLQQLVDPHYRLPAPATGQAAAPQLAVPVEAVPAAPSGDRLALLDPEGVTLATLTITSFAADGDRIWLAGPVTAQTGFQHLDHPDLRRSPDAVATTWSPGPVLALWSEPPLPLVVRQAARDWAAAEDGSVLEVVPVPSGQETSLAAQLGPRLARLETTRGPRDQLVVVPDPGLSWSGPELGRRAAIAKRLGATHLGVRSEALEAIEPHERPADAADVSGVQLTTLAVPKGQGQLVRSALDELLAADEPLPEWFAEPTVAAEIRRLVRPPQSAGFTVLLSGLSGSGKSTVARALAVRLLETEVRSVSLLDGDVVRHHLSKGLGFARADRVTNVRRIGYVASEITKAGGIAICCPIAPYEATRQDVRSMVQEHGGFYLVHVATPLEECERRDRKGLYAKARRGEIPEFTGISDPYEIPTDAELTIDTTGRTIDSCVDEVLVGLQRSGYLGP